MATQPRTQSAAKIKVPQKVLKANREAVDKQRKAEEQVMNDPFLRRLFAKDQKRQSSTQKTTMELWWDRGVDVISVRRKSALEKAKEGEEVEEGGVPRAQYGSRDVTLLATALGLDVRAFHRAADFVLLFDEKQVERDKFFDRLAKAHGEDSVPSWTHVETMLKKVVPHHKDKSDEIFTDLLATVAREKLSVRAFADMLDEKFKSKGPKRKITPREAIRQLDAALVRAVEALGPGFEAAADTIGDDYSEVVDPQAVREAVLQALTRVSDVARVLTDGEAKLIARAEGLREYIATLPVAAPPPSEADADPTATPEAATPAEPAPAGEGDDPAAAPTPEPSVAA